MVIGLVVGFQVDVFKNCVQNFFDCCISYFQQWGSLFTESQCLSQTLLEHAPETDEVECSLRNVSTKLPQTGISETELIDEVASVNTYTSKKD